MWNVEYNWNVYIFLSKKQKKPNGERFSIFLEYENTKSVQYTISKEIISNVIYLFEFLRPLLPHTLAIHKFPINKTFPIKHFIFNPLTHMMLLCSKQKIHWGRFKLLFVTQFIMIREFFWINEQFDKINQIFG